jgi:hypothetical protein
MYPELLAVAQSLAIFVRDVPTVAVAAVCQQQQQ